MIENLSLRGAEYSFLADRAIQDAFRIVYNEVEQAQNRLRAVNPNNPLLPLIILHDNRQGCDFHPSFKSRILEHDLIDPTQFDKSGLNFYYLLGAYVDILETECVSPKFLSS